jgi:hypothetical protein
MKLDNDIPARVIGAGRRRTEPAASALLVAGAALILASAIIHLHLWVGGLRSQGAIGNLYFAQGVIGIFLSLVIAIVRRISVALLGALFTVGTIVSLMFASHGGIFGYQTTLSAPWATTSLVIEALSVGLLVAGGVLAVSLERAHVRRWRSLRGPEA